MHPRLALSIGNFFGAAHYFLIAYVIAPYLALFLPESRVGLVVSLGAVLTLSAFPFMPRLVRAFGAKRLALALAFAQSVTISVLALTPSLPFAVACVALACAISPLIAYQLDLLLEAATLEEGSTGRIRTLFTTSANVALVLSPLVISNLLGDTVEYGRVFLAASLSLAPFIALFAFERLPEGEPPRLSRFWACVRCLWSDGDLRAAALGNGVLQFFYHLAPLYVPLYLHAVLGFAWNDLGWVFAVMLLPFAFMEYPAGYIADRWLGDKELLVAGFVIAGTAFAAMALVTPATQLSVIAAVLLASRIGAALTEAMVEGHFFRRVSERDATTITAFRMMRPVGALLAPLFASALLLTGNYPLFFIASGALIVAAGVVVTVPLRDIR